jgi:hypothetical protein
MEFGHTLTGQRVAATTIPPALRAGHGDGRR